MTATAPFEDLLPDIRLGVVRATSFGLFGPPETFVPQARSMGAGIVRVNIFWSQVEPEPGRWVWEAVDSLLDQLEDGVEAWVTVCAGSRWATRHATGWLPASPAVDLDRYRRFVSELVGRRPGRIRFWQCEIEPCLRLFWAGTAEEYVTHLREFYGAVKEADPDALVVLGGAVPGAMLGDGAAGAKTWASFFGEVLRATGEYFDVFDVHPYGDPYLVPALIDASRSQMAIYGYQKPVVAGEHGGPLPIEFRENLPHLKDVLVANQQQFQGEVPMPDTAEELVAAEDAAVVELYERMDELAPTLQMFMVDCPEELADRRHRLACRDLVMRTMLALSTGVRRTFHYPLAPERPLRRDGRFAGALLFGKLALMDCDGDALGDRYPAADTFELLARKLAGADRVRRLTVPDLPDLYLFEVQRGDRAPLLVVWERRDSEEDKPPTEFTWNWPHPQAIAVDVFDSEIPSEARNGVLRVEVTPTPIFIDVA
ncbi:hypothetical protein DFR70_102327 [Nocardia tenerifensis]|uniref:Glycosyl hydrolase family 39 n=1 Tax=Nocardia tenerifensis TaxID=228006 RepID=A0A318K6W9_9NOCA|nr:hypothetical protein [Nocardia tenerifensis]PXX68643.1 hypothetical protein DFR70_102327 [Nocardia tenerifensis]